MIKKHAKQYPCSRLLKKNVNTFIIIIIFLSFPVQKTNRYLIKICSKQLIHHLEGLVKHFFFFRSNGSNIPYCLDQNANSRQCLMQKLPSNDISEPLGAFKRMLEPRDVS